ncbi:MAG: DegT/DnrJ/EryC1/StrS family aminotransferase [bacterium JZ-2024 1]
MPEPLRYEDARDHPIRSSMLPFFVPSISEGEIEEVAQTLKSGWLTQGEKVAEFEEQLKAIVGAPHIVSLSSCTAALFLSLNLMDLEPGDEVITTPFTFVSTVNVILHNHLKPVFADIRRDTLNIDENEVASRITPRTRAILPVHFAGFPANLDPLRALATSHKLIVVEDAAHALGAEYNGSPIGASGEFVCFSFYPNKNITTAEGGALATSNAEWADKARSRRIHGMSQSAWERARSSSWKYNVDYPGFKIHLTDLQASIGIVQLRRFRHLQQLRASIADYYRQSFHTFPAIQMPGVPPPYPAQSSHHLFPILLDLERLTVSRDEFAERLRALNISTSVHYYPVHLFGYYQKSFGYRKGDLPNAEWAFERILSLPIYPGMRLADAEDVVCAVARVVSETLR